MDINSESAMPVEEVVPVADIVKGVIPVTNSIVKDGRVLGYLCDTLVDGKRMGPPPGHPLGFMVRRGDSWCAEFDSSWTTSDAADERARRLNEADERVKRDRIKWAVYVV